jgi:hypothetical protein
MQARGPRVSKKGFSRVLTMKTLRRSSIVVMLVTGSLQNTLSMKLCSSGWRNTDTAAGPSPASIGPYPCLCATGGRTGWRILMGAGGSAAASASAAAAAAAAAPTTAGGSGSEP